MKIRSLLVCSAFALAAAAAAAPAWAASYDLFNDFGSSVFSYGGGTPGADFTAFNGSSSNCFGYTGVVCYNFANSSGFPFVGKNESGAPTTYFPTNALSFQPDGNDGALIRFTAPTAGIYTISGFSASEDPSGGQGQTISIFDSVHGTSTSLYSTELTGTYQTSTPFNDLIAPLGAGDTITFGVSGGLDNTTSGIEATIQSSPSAVSAAPEPSTWLLMIAGLGGIGLMLRRAKKTMGFGFKDAFAV